MPADGAPAGHAVHATAVAIDGHALLITGPSGAGKSRLALALVAASTPHHRIELVGDDRVLLRSSEHGLEVRPHPRIAGFIERRGLGLVAAPWRGCAIVAGLAILGKNSGPPDTLLRGVATVRLEEVCATSHEAVLAWWSGFGMKATQRRCEAAPDAFRL